MLNITLVGCDTDAVSMRSFPVHHGLRDLTVLDRGACVHLYLSLPASKEVLDCSDIARRHRGCLGAKCVANIEREVGLRLRWFRAYHPKCAVWRCEPERWREETGTRCLYRARTSFCSPDFDMTVVSLVLIKTLDTAGLKGRNWDPTEWR